MSKRIRKLPEEQREQFQAYGEYTYDYVHQPDGQEPQASPGPETEKPMTVQAAKARRCRRKTEGFFKFLVVLAILTVAVVVVQEKFFRLKTVYVIGNETKTPQQVVAASGLVQGRNMLGIEEQDVARAISKDHTIIFKGMQKEYPGTIYLYIEERKTVAAMQWLGVLYLLDGEGMVMQQQSGSDLPEGLPVVTGFRASNIYVGQKLMVRSQNQLDAYCKIMYELEQQLYGGYLPDYPGGHYRAHGQRRLHAGQNRRGAHLHGLFAAAWQMQRRSGRDPARGRQVYAGKIEIVTKEFSKT